MIEFDLSDLEDRIRAFEDEVIAGAQRAVELAARKGVAEAKRTKRYKDQTGELSGRANATTLRRSPRGGECFMLWPSRYASFVDSGTPPHRIAARRAGALVFFWPKLATTVFFGSVNHPGTRPYGFAGVAYHQAEQTLAAEIERAIARASSKL